VIDEERLLVKSTRLAFTRYKNAKSVLLHCGQEDIGSGTGGAAWAWAPHF